jgi:hypothetical protein
MRAKIQATATFCCRDGTRPHLTSDVLTCVIRNGNGRGECSNARGWFASAGKRRSVKSARPAPIAREEGLPFLTAPAEWCGGDTTTRYERIAAIGGFVGAADGLHVVVGGLCSLRSALWSKLQQKLVEF